MYSSYGGWLLLKMQISAEEMCTFCGSLHIFERVD